MSRLLRAGDLVKLVSPGYGQPSGPCVVVIDQKPGELVWYAAAVGGTAHVARRGALRLICQARRREGRS